MKRFIIHISTFILVFSIVFCLIQWYANNLKNDYESKNENLKHKFSQIKILCFGDSQTLYGVNPEFLTKEGFNLAYVSQTLDIDNLLLEKYISELDNLEYLLVQISYTSFFEILGYQSDAWRIINYRRYYNINPIIDDSKELDLQITSCRNNLLKLENKIKGKDLVLCNEWGFEKGYDYKNSLTDFKQSAIDAANRHKAKSFEHLSENVKNLESIIEKSRKNGAKVIIYTPPVHYAYLQKLDSLQLKIMHETIEDILNKNQDIVYLDWASNSSFSDSDFYDSNHLNDRGAEKLTQKLDSFLK